MKSLDKCVNNQYLNHVFYLSSHINLDCAACVEFDTDLEPVNKNSPIPQALSGFCKADR